MFKFSWLPYIPAQSIITDDEKANLTNPSLLEAVLKIDTIGKSIASISRRKVILHELIVFGFRERDPGYSGT